MFAVNTDLIVRYLVRDDPHQSELARVLVDQQDIFVSLTVLLETEWVLRSAYEIPADGIVKALRTFLGLPTVTAGDPLVAAQALDWAEAGMDFADALHLASAEGCEAFISFDEHFAKKAKALGCLAVRKP